MSSINPNQLNAMAQEIANLLDAKENSKTTKGDGQIEASIWNQFVGEGQSEDKQIGNGQKSLIKDKIPFKNAISSIASYIKNKGTAAIQDALKRVGIDWEPSVDVKANSNIQQDKGTNKLDPRLKSVAKQKLKAMQEQTDKTQKKCEELEKQKNTVTTDVTINGKTQKMTYNQIRDALYEFRNVGDIVYDESTGESHPARLRDAHEYLRNKAERHPESDAQQRLEKLESLLAAKHELERQYPDFKNYRYIGVQQSDGSFKYIEDNARVNHDFIDE